MTLGGGAAERAREPLGDLAGGLVGEGEGADARRVDAELLDEEADALDEAVRLPRPGPGEHEQRRGLGLDRLAL